MQRNVTNDDNETMSFKNKYQENDIWFHQLFARLLDDDDDGDDGCCRLIVVVGLQMSSSCQMKIQTNFFFQTTKLKRRKASKGFLIK